MISISYISVDSHSNIIGRSYETLFTIHPRWIIKSVCKQLMYSYLTFGNKQLRFVMQLNNQVSVFSSHRSIRRNLLHTEICAASLYYRFLVKWILILETRSNERKITGTMHSVAFCNLKVIRYMLLLAPQLFLYYWKASLSHHQHPPMIQSGVSWVT